ncbi:Phosphatidylserine decarboxylase proenzyme 3, partial [Leucoagaricus sp. SymC.cos]
TADTVTGADSSAPTTPPSSQSSASSSSSAARRKRGTGYKFAGGNDIIGIVMLDVLGAEDLPRLRNMTRTGWDMDPFVVISFGKKVFRTRVIRHSRNPLWDEKLLFHVRKYETSFNVQLTIMDWDKLSSNDHIGDVSFNVKELLDSAPQPGENGLYDLRDGILEYPMKEYKMPLVVAKDVSWDNKNNPVISFKAKYQPYDALRQRFWCQYMKQYDADGTNALSHLEITSMLDSLGSTLSSSTISDFFKRYGKRADEDELTFDKMIICLEEELNRPEDQKKRLDVEDGDPNSSVSATPVLQVSDQTGKTLELDQLDFSGPATLHNTLETDPDKIPAPIPTKTEPMQVPLHYVAAPATPTISVSPVESSSNDAEEDLSSSSLGRSSAISGGVTFGATLTPISPPPTTPKGGGLSSSPSSSASNSSSERDSSLSSDGVERVINVKSCPLCRRPRMNSKAEMDIMTHIAVCASQDWNRVDRIV